MLNIEYYKDELKEIIIRNIGINAITGKPKMCDDLFCLDCVFNDRDACRRTARQNLLLLFGKQTV